MTNENTDDFKLKLDDYRPLLPPTTKMNQAILDIFKLTRKFNIKIKFTKHKPEINKELKNKLGL